MCEVWYGTAIGCCSLLAGFSDLHPDFTLYFPELIAFFHYSLPAAFRYGISNLPFNYSILPAAFSRSSNFDVVPLSYLFPHFPNSSNIHLRLCCNGCSWDSLATSGLLDLLPHPRGCVPFTSIGGIVLRVNPSCLVSARLFTFS